LAGAFLASITFNRESYPAKHLKNEILTSLGLISLILVFIKLPKTVPYPSYWALWPTISTMLIIQFGQNTQINKWLLSNRTIIYIGLISYPLYLWHWPLISFARIMNYGEITPLGKLFCLVVSIVLAIFTYEVIEKNIRHNKNKYTVKLLLIALCISGILGLMTFYKNGLPGRHPTQEASLNAMQIAQQVTLDVGNNHNLCLPGKWLNPSIINCRISNNQKAPTVVIIGDSHAGQNYSGLAYHHRQHGENMMLIYRGGCAPLYGTQVYRKGDSLACKKAMEDAFDYIFNEPSIKEIILSFRAPWLIYGGGKSFHDKYKNPYIIEPSLEDGFRRTYEMAEKFNKKLILIIDNPEMGFRPEECFDTRPLNINLTKIRNPCGVKKEQALIIAEPYFKIVNSIKNDLPNLKIFDSFKYFCDEEFCYAKKDEKLFFADDNHLTLSGSLYIAEKYFIEKHEKFKQGLKD
jgi:hypothetical protein